MVIVCQLLIRYVHRLNWSANSSVFTWNELYVYPYCWIYLPMYWIEGLTQTPFGFELQAVHQNGARTLEKLDGLSNKVTTGRTSRTKMTTDFGTWSKCSGLPFWEYLEIDGYGPNDGHHVFKVNHENTVFLIPAAVLIGAMIRPIKHIHPFLFRPHGLAQMSVPLLDDSAPKVGFFLPVHRVTGTECAVTNGLLASYSWMHCFPSAHSMWDSVFHEAKNGLLNIQLPKANISTNLHSVAWKDVQLVTNMVITNLHAEEAPFDFASGHSRDIIFHQSSALDWAHEHRPKKALPDKDGVWSISDTEWSQLAPKLQKGKPRKHNLRLIVDLILEKLGTQTPWSKLNFMDLNKSIVLITYQRMQQDGRWSIIEETLRSSRGQYASQPY